MGVCLLAMARSRAYLELGYASLNEYAEKSLKMSGKKAHLLVLTVRALEHLPLFSAAYQDGFLCWGKLRSLQSVVTPETEETWLAYALERTVAEVVGAVSMSPAAWKRQEGLNASLKQNPIVEPQDVQQVFDEQEQIQMAELAKPDDLEVPLTSEAPVTETSSPVPQAENSRPLRPGPAEAQGEVQGEVPSAGEGEEERPFAPPSLVDLSAKTIRVTVEFTPDQYAIFEMSERCAKAQVGGRADRASAVVRMCEAHLASTPSRTRLKYQVLVHTSAEGEQGWYDTGRGPLPASLEVVRQAKSDSERATARATTAPRKVTEAKAAETKVTEAKAAETKVTETKVTETKAVGEKVTAEAETLEKSEVPGEGQSPASPHLAGRSRRETVPAAILRALYLRAGNRCERCGCTNAGLHVHHKRPVCEGGTNDLEGLELLCGPCHSGHHETDFQSKPHWQAARNKAVGRSRRERAADPTLVGAPSTSTEQPAVTGSGHLSSA